MKLTSFDHCGPTWDVQVSENPLSTDRITDVKFKKYFHHGFVFENNN